MAIIHATSIGKAKGSIGMNTYTTVGGATIAKEKVFNPKIPRTYRQMVRRVRWANIVAMWQSFSGNLHPSFEGKRPRVSDFNEFMRYNIGGVPVYLTSEEANQGACVMCAYEITRGSLPSINLSAGVGDVPVTNISLGSLVIDEDTTLAQFSNAVVNNNPDFLDGDQIACFIGTQEQNSVTGIPYVSMKSYEVTLDTSDSETLLADIVAADGFSVVGGKLGAASTIVGGIAYVHSREVLGETQVSSQSFFVTNALLVQYQTAAKRNAAVVSYKGNLTTAFLTPNRTTDASPVTP